eukprot:CAMPEP_0115527360 /NCGR_PEP_ID=MMETSP0271-20121206/82804_1 /TAXON_ID=71861 /ORGANISM="Scrippsiella trochoidea, Strain CCMP3099" /LENGTH=54 /DNA_ID=CAMNT_0002959185 /DNA_START=121 /DNA_END=281 /DNA_ORIENTATION=-
MTGTAGLAFAGCLPSTGPAHHQVTWMEALTVRLTSNPQQLVSLDVACIHAACDP